MTAPAEGGALGVALRATGAVLASTTVLTALLFYFGMQHAYWFCQYFGVNYTVLELTTTDLLLRSADGLFVPLTVAAVAAMAGVWLYRLGHGRSPAPVRRWAARAGTPVAAVVGAALLAVAAAALLAPAAFGAVLALPGLCLIGGTALVVLASRRQRVAAERRGRPPLPPAAAAVEWAVLFALVAVGLFWSAGDYSARVGTSRAVQLAQQLPTWPDATLYAAQGLSLPPTTAQETACRADAAYPVRYTGLKLVFATAGHYFLLPAGWRPGRDPAVVVPRSEALRLDFAAPGRLPSPTC